MERNGLGYALGIFIFLANNFRLVSSNFLHERSSIFQIFLKNFPLCCSARRGLPFGGRSPELAISNSVENYLFWYATFFPFNYQEQNDSEGEIDERRSKDKHARKLVGQRWKNLELLNGKTTGSYYTAGTR